ncbi:MAG: hypothetical protein JNJ80_15775 [Gemmatimonadetes bacterium]|nr:hypothetical protein [Gemmatimonadota bacterium]
MSNVGAPSGTAERSSRLAWWPVGAAAAGLLLVARRQFLTGDPTYYLGLGQALAAGRGYTFMGEPHTFYPPGLSLLLAPFLRVFGGRPLVGQVVIAAFLPLAVLAAMVLARQRGARVSQFVGVACAFSYALFSQGTSGLRSELPFLVVSITLLAVQTGRISAAPVRLALLAAAVAIAAVALRTIGIALALAGLMAWGHRRLARRPFDAGTDLTLLAGGVAGVACFAAWVWWGARHGSPGYAGYLLLADPHQPDLGVASAADLGLRVLGNVLRRLTGVAEMLTNLPWLASMWASPLTIGLAASLAVGVREQLRAAVPVVGWYFLGYGAILALWPFSEGVRFLVPIFPVLLVLGWDGARVIGGWLVGPAAAMARRVATLVAMIAFPLAMVEARIGPVPSRQMTLLAASWIGIAGALVLPGAWDRLAAGVRKRAWSVSLVAILLYVAVGLARIVPAAAANVAGEVRSPNREIAPGIDWLSRQAASTDVVMAEFPSAVHFYTGLRAVPFPKTGVAESLVVRVISTGVDFLVVGDPPRFPYYRPTEVERLAILRSRLGSRVRQVYRYEKGAVYRID